MRQSKLSAKILTTMCAVALAACEPSSAPGAQNAARDPNRSAWVLDAGGDLNGFFECLEAEGATLVSAHRGGPYPGYPENAIETMDAILAEIPAVMEVDIVTSADGVLYLMHDDTLERTTSGEGPVSDLAWSEISALKLEDNDGKTTTFAPPTLAEALAWAEGRTILQLDIKSSTRYEDVAAELARQNAADRVILISYSMASAQKLHRLMPDAMISLAVDSQSEVNRAVAAGVPADRIMGWTGTESPRPRLFSILNNRDIEVIFGTLGRFDSIDQDIARSGDEDRYATIAASGVDIIATDRPKQAHAALAAAGRSADGACGVTRP